MLWTFAAFFLVMSLVLLQFLRKVVEKVKDAYFIYPSDAVIDQVLPQEIMEHMMTFLDPRAMIECRLVSKYWRHHAIKPNIEASIVRGARTRVRETYEDMKSRGLEVSEGVIERVINNEARDTLLIRSSAIASKHGAELLLTDPTLSVYLFTHNNWNDVKKDKKYLVLTEAAKSNSPLRFTAGTTEFGTQPVFDQATLDWNETEPYSMFDILFDPSTLPSYYQNNVKLYLAKPRNPPKYFYFIPLNDKFLHVLMFLFSPMIVHDALQSSYLPTIKSWFGPIAFIASIILQIMIARLFVRNNGRSKAFNISLAVFFTSYFLLTYISYPVSMSVFAGMAIQALMFIYIMFSKEYFRSYANPGMNRRKWQLFMTGILLIFLMIDWKLVVDAVRDLSIFRTLFENTFCYSIILLHFIFDNYLSYVSNREFDWKFLLKWDRSTVSILRNCYLLVMLMTLVAPTWRGNHL